MTEPTQNPAATTSSDMHAYNPGAPVLFRHTKRDVWGLGIVIRKADDRVHMQFQDGRKRTFIDGYYHFLDAVDRPLDITMSIVDGLKSMCEGFDDEQRLTNAPRVKEISLDEQIVYFHEKYEDGFQSAEWTEDHRGDGRKRPLKRHRDPAVAKAKDLLSKAAFKQSPAEIHAAAVKVVKMTGLVPAKERKAFAGIEEEQLEGVTNTLRALLYGDSKLQNRFNAHVRALESAMGQTPSWQLATVFLGLVRAEAFPVVKEGIFQRQANWMAPGLRLPERPMGLLFERLVAMTDATRERMEEKGLKPRDMLDVRDFMWLTLKPAGRKRIMEMRQEARLAEPTMPQEDRETAAA